MNKKLIQSLNPKFVFWVRFFELNKILFLLFVFYCFIMPFIACDIKEQHLNIVTLIIILITLFILLFLVWLDKKNFEVSSYKIFNDRVEFEEGFINHKYIAIKFEDIKEVHLSQNFFQRMVNIGTIKFITAANNTGRNTGVAFTDIENSNYVYAKVKELLNK